MGPQRRFLPGAAGRSAGDYRAQWRGEIDAAQDPFTRNGAHQRAGQGARTHRLAAGGGHRLSPRADRAREHLPERRHLGHVQTGSPAQVRRDRQFCRGGKIRGYARQALLQRDVRAPGVCGSRPPRIRDPAGGRGPGCWGRGVSEEVSGEDGRCGDE